MTSRRTDEGFTVIELLIAMMLMLLLLTPLVASFVIGVRATTDTAQDALNSADAQLLAGFYDIDVANADTVATDVAVANSCGGSGAAGLLGADLQLSWLDGGAISLVSYRRRPDAAMLAELAAKDSSLATGFTAYELQRLRCVGGAVTETHVVARSLIAAGSSSPSLITCWPLACTATASKPRTVRLQLTDQSTLLTDKGATTNRFNFGVIATRRVTP
jgi:Tfp pilus assembly protein PilW